MLTDTVPGTTKDVGFVHKTSRGGETLSIVDTPGLFELKQTTTTVLKAMKEKVPIDTRFTLLYCLGVGPGHGTSQQDTDVIKSLTDTFGEGVWKRCVLALTYSDSIRRDSYPLPGNDEYISHLKSSISLWQEAFVDINVNIPIKLVFELSPEEDRSNCIVSIPVAKTKESGGEYKIWPEYNIEEGVSWTDYAFFEVLKKSGRHSVTLAFIRYPAIAGAIVGGVLGIIGGPEGVFFGSILGAGIVLRLKKGPSANFSFEEIREELKKEYEEYKLKKRSSSEN